jgi:uncharacterized protein YjiS (DUF1127 family)
MHAYSKDPARLAAYATPSTLSAVKAALAGAIAGAAAWLAETWIGKLVSASLREREARLAIEELKSWDDHMLRDIGLERMQIEPAVRGLVRPLPLNPAAPAKPPQPHF